MNTFRTLIRGATVLCALMLIVTVLPLKSEAGTTATKSCTIVMSIEINADVGATANFGIWGTFASNINYTVMNMDNVGIPHVSDNVGKTAGSTNSPNANSTPARAGHLDNHLINNANIDIGGAYKRSNTTTATRIPGSANT